MSQHSHIENKLHLICKDEYLLEISFEFKIGW